MHTAKVFAGAVLAVVLVSLVAGMQASSVNAQSEPGPAPPIEITLTNIANGTVYDTNTPTFKLTLYAYPWGSQDRPDNFDCVLSLDGKFVKRYYYSGSQMVILRNVSEGQHYVQLDASAVYTWEGGQVPVSSSTGRIYFTVDSATPVKTLTATMLADGAAVTLLTSRPTSWIAYSLDGANNVTITSQVAADRLGYLYNYTYRFTGLAEGEHTLTYYFQSTTGNIELIDTLNFTVGNPSPTPSASPSPLPTQSAQATQAPTQEPSFTPNDSPITNPSSDWIVYAVVAATGIVCAGTLFYFKKRRRK